MSAWPGKTVYLSGPIAGLAYGEARQGWREQVMEHLNAHIWPLSPMRYKDFLAAEKEISGKSGAYACHPQARDRGIVTRDTNDVRTCDAVLVYLLGASRVSIGTVSEIGMAHAFNKPIVLVMEHEGNLHHHPFVTEMAGYWVDDLGEGCRMINSLLTPGV